MQLVDDAPLLRRVAARIVGDANADDVVQETFLRALSAPPRDLTTSIRPWLVTVARHVAIDWLRQHGRLDDVEPDELPGSAPESQHPSELAALLAGLGRLSEGEVVVLLLRDVLDLSVDEVADALATSAGTVRVMHLRARRKAAAGDGPDAAGLVALERFLTWLMAREIAGLPVRGGGSGGFEPAFRAGVMEAQGALLDAVVEVAARWERPELEARARISRGTVRMLLAPEAALQDFERALALGADGVVARDRMSWILLQLGRRKEARIAAEGALAGTSDPRVRSRLHQFLAFLHHEAGDAEAARTHLASAKEAGGGSAWLASGIALLLEGRPEEARVDLLAALASAREGGSPRDEVVALIDLSAACLDLGDYEATEEALRHAHELVRRQGDRMRETTVVGNLAQLARHEGRFDDAAEGYARTLALARETGRPAYEDLYAMNAAVLDHLRGRLPRARAELRAILDRMTAAGRLWDAAQARTWLTGVEAELGVGRADAFERTREAVIEAGATALPLALDVLSLLGDLGEPSRRAHALEAARAAEEQIRITRFWGARSAVHTAVQLVTAAVARAAR